MCEFVQRVRLIRTWRLDLWKEIMSRFHQLLPWKKNDDFWGFSADRGLQWLQVQFSFFLSSSSLFLLESASCSYSSFSYDFCVWKCCLLVQGKWKGFVINRMGLKLHHCIGGLWMVVIFSRIEGVLQSWVRNEAKWRMGGCCRLHFHFPCNVIISVANCN